MPHDRKGRNGAERLLRRESVEPGESIASPAGCYNKLPNSQIQDGLSSGFFEGLNRGLVDLLREIESSLDGQPTAERLNDARSLLVKAAQSIMVQSEILSELHHLALTDELTGFYNRRGFLVLGTQQLKIARRSGHSLLLFFGDLDHLKRVNDAYGHDEGDALLLRCSVALKTTFRESDIVARLGGDEFAILAAEGADRSLEAIIGRLNESVRDVNTRGGRTSLSLSLGVSRFDPGAPMTLGELLTAADRDMYRHKRKRSPAPASELSTATSQD